MTLKEVKSARDFCKVAKNIVLLQCHKKKCDSGSVGRALASQAEGRGFESRLSLEEIRKGHQVLVAPF